jgi:hypothetical protein
LFFSPNNPGDQVKNNEMRGARNTYEGKKYAQKAVVEQRDENASTGRCTPTWQDDIKRVKLNQLEWRGLDWSGS